MFLAERPDEHHLQVVLGVRVDDAAAFKPPKSGTVKRKFTKQHWGALQMLLLDPDGREVAVEAPSPRKPAGKRAKVSRG